MIKKSVQGFTPLIVIFVVVIFLAVVVYFVYNNGGTTRSIENSKVSTDKNIVIGLALGTLREERWINDRDLFVARAKELGANVVVQSANSDSNLQVTQIENFITQGIKVIVVVPHDGEKIASVIQKAHDRGVKIIAYDRLIKNSDLDLYISFDNVKVGQMQAKGVMDAVAKGNFAYIGGSPTDNNTFLVKQGSMSVLNPKIESGDIKLVLDKFTESWNPDVAYKNMKSYLDSGGTVDAVVAANDGTAFGVIQALREKGLAGKVPVSGQDAELSACQRIVQGLQTVTVYKPIKSLASKAAELAVALVKNDVLDTNNKINNGKIDVPSYLIEPMLVNKDNMMETIIKDNFHSYDQVYKGS